MMTQLSQTQQIQESLVKHLQSKDSSAQVIVRRNTLGWLNLRIATTLFTNLSLPEREQEIDNALSLLNLSLGEYPFAGYELLTPDEADRQPQSVPVQLPLWSEILMRPDPDQPVAPDEDPSRRPFIVTFYSFKGGVGRTTALGLVAGILAKEKERRVVMIDLDLEAPGLSSMFPNPKGDTAKNYGVLDYLHQRYLTPDRDLPKLNECFYQIDLPARGELYLVPIDVRDEGYIHRLADLDVRLLYQRVPNPLHRLLDDVKTELDPDVILIDARAGFSEISAVALFDRTDLAIVCFSPTDQSFDGLRWVVQAARKQRDYRGVPDLHFLLTPIPTVDQSKTWIARAEDWIADNWGTPSSRPANDLHNDIWYNAAIATLPNLINNVPSILSEPYRPVAEIIDASLPESKREYTIKISSEERSKILTEVKFRAAIAQDMEPDDIRKIFQRTGDFPKFLEDRNYLIRGAKGTGKSLLFRLFVEQPGTAKELARPYADLSHIDFIAGHGRAGLQKTILNTNDFDSYERQIGNTGWRFFWQNYVLLQLSREYPEVRSLNTLDSRLAEISAKEQVSHAEIVQWLVERAQSPLSGPQANDGFDAIDRWLNQNSKKVWIFYDELDSGFGQDNKRRQRALEELFAWWLEISSSLKNITPKILLREDIWNNLNLTNQGHYQGRSIQLRWDEADLWRLVLRQLLNSSDTFQKLVNDKFGLAADRLDNIEEELLRQSLYPLWNMRMGRTKKAYTHNWVRSRITDTQDNRFPRSLILLLQAAVEIEKSYAERNVYESVLRPLALINALPSISKQRVEEVRNEYPEFIEFLTKLRNESSPISIDRLSEVWELRDADLKALVVNMVQSGIMKEYARPSEEDKARYSIAEIYLSGLDMKRKGQR